MGKKDKDRDKEGRSKHGDKEKRRRRHSSDSDNEGELREKKKSKKHRHSREEEETRHKSSKRDSDKPKERKDKVKEERKEDPPVVTPKSSGDAISLSIEETNKLRAQLGLKPLVVDSGQSAKVKGETEGTSSTTDRIAPMKTEDVHVPPKNIADIKKAEKLKEKMEVMKETREITKKLRSVKGLAEEDEEEESASQWVLRMREIQKEKELAQKRARLLEEMDEEFGVSDLVEKAFKEKQKEAYTSQSLAGLKVEHTQERFKEGDSVVLTLKDKGVLDNDDDDVLMNVLLRDQEHAERNVQLRSGRSEYRPYDEEETDEYGMPKTRSLLSKYDEEIEGVEKKAFTLGSGGSFDTQEEEREKEMMRQRLQEGRVSLHQLPAVVASEYYTPEEMVSFRKPTKKRKLRKKTKLKADDLVPLADEQRDSKDHGRRVVVKEEVEDMETDANPDAALLDEADSRTDTALKRTRRLLQMKLKSSDPRGASRVTNMITRVKTEPDPVQGEGDEGSAIVLDTLSEFCRHLGGEEEGEEEERKPMSPGGEEDSNEEMEADVGDKTGDGGWATVEDSEAEKAEKGLEEDELYQEAEPVVSAGVTAALQMAVRKGFMEEEEDARQRRIRESSSFVKVEGYNVGVRDADYERERKRERDRDRDSHLRDMPFPEKRNYTPEVNIEYVDNLGRLLPPKEAFRQMSHKFHGKGSGKRKTEKRLKKLQEEFFLNRSSIVDTPLQTVEMQRQKQESAQTPYLVLTGLHQNVHMTDLAKTKRK